MNAPALDPADGEAEVLARITLSRACEPGDEAIGTWIEEVGAMAAADALRRGSCPLSRGPAYVARLAAAEREPEADLDQARAAGVRVVVPGTSAWPTQLDDLGARRPLLLWLRGPADLRTAALCSVAMVGARSATAYGDRVTVEMAADLATLGWTVVSGGAYGIDAAAHRGALAVDGVTVAVLANGPDRYYPRSNDALLARIADTGVVLTELPPGEHPTRSRFLERNRVVAALSRGTVVVEAARRSGALSTASRANALNRPVMAVPGPVTSAVSVGTHSLVRDGEAVLVTGADQVLELLRPLGRDAPAGTRGDGRDTPGRHDRPEESADGANGSASADARPLDGLDPGLRAVHDALALRRPRTVDDIASRAGLEVGRTLGLLADLRVRALAERVEGGWRAVRPR